MSTLDRRLQLLLDQERYDRVAAEAERSGRSVAAVIREAIDLCFADADIDVRRRAAIDLLAMTSDPTGGATDDWAAMKRDYESQVDEVVERP